MRDLFACAIDQRHAGFSERDQETRAALTNVENGSAAAIRCRVAIAHRLARRTARERHHGGLIGVERAADPRRDFAGDMGQGSVTERRRVDQNFARQLTRERLAERYVRAHELFRNERAHTNPVGAGIGLQRGERAAHRLEAARVERQLERHAVQIPSGARELEPAQGKRARAD